MLIRRVFVALSSVLLQAAPLLAFQPPATGQSEFVPMTEIPPSDQLPAAPLLVAAYAFVWIAAIFYMWTIWRRLRRVETDMQALEARQAKRGSTR